MSNNDFLATLLAGVGHVPTPAEIAADTRARAIARADHCAAVLARTIAEHGYGARSDAAATDLAAACAASHAAAADSAHEHCPLHGCVEYVCCEPIAA